MRDRREIKKQQKQQQEEQQSSKTKTFFPIISFPKLFILTIVGSDIISNIILT